MTDLGFALGAFFALVVVFTVARFNRRFGRFLYDAMEGRTPPDDPGDWEPRCDVPDWGAARPRRARHLTDGRCVTDTVLTDGETRADLRRIGLRPDDWGIE